MTQVATPVGQRCLHCEEPIEPGDRGLMMGVVDDLVGQHVATVQPVHLECDLRSTLSHVFGQCCCFVQHPTVRSEALAVLMAINDERARQGIGPL